MMPKAARVAIMRIPRRNEKSLRVMNTVAVSPPKMSSVNSAAFSMMYGSCT